MLQFPHTTWYVTCLTNEEVVEDTQHRVGLHGEVAALEVHAREL